MKFRKLLAMVLAVAMIASLAPVLRTTAKAEYVEDNGTIYGSTTAAEKYKDIKISIEEVSSGPYKVGSLIKYLVTFKNAGTSDISFKSIKIHNYNTEDDALKKGFPGITMPKTNNVQYSIVESDKSNTSVGVFQSGNIQNLNYKTGEDHKMISESEYTSYTSPSQRKNNLEALIDNDKPSSGDKPLVIMPADSYFQFYMEFKVEETDKGKTLHNFLGFHLGDSNADNAVGAYIQSSADHVSNSETGKLVLKNTIDGGSETSSQFTVTIKDKDYNGTPSGDASVTLTDTSDNKGKTATFSLASGQTVTFPDVTDATQFTVEQSALSGYTTLSAVKQDTEPSAGEATKVSTISGEVLGDSSTPTTYVSFFNTISGGTPLPPSPTGATYHLNLPNDSEFSGLYEKDFAYTDTDSERNGVLEIGDILQWTFEGDTITTSSDKFAKYKEGEIGTGTNTYYFVGWSNDDTKLSYNESGEYNYKDIKYPVVNIGGDKNWTRNIYAYPSGSEGKSDQKQNGPFKCEDANLYAIWVKADNSTGNRGLYGYTMQLAGAKFPGAEGDDPFQWFTQSGGAGAKLGLNGYNSNTTWLKYAVLDGGHYKGDNKPLTVEAPNTPVDGWDFIGWFNKNANKGDDPNKDYFVAPAGGRVTGANNQVEYGDSHGVYSVDAIWSKITGATDQVVLYKAGGSSPDFSNIAVNLTDGGYTNGSGRSDQTGWESIFGAKGTSVTAARDKLSYYVEVSGPENIGRTKYTQSGLSDIKLTKPGKYTITVNPKLEDVDTSGGKGGKTGVTIDFGTITFNYTIIPQLTVEVTKNLTGRDWTSGDRFEFSVTADNGATVNEGTITITNDDDDHKGTAIVSFGEIAGATGSTTYTITISETNSGETGMDYADSQTITVTLNKASDGTYTLSGANLESDGNYKTAVTMTNAYNQPTGSLTITKTVTGTNAPSVWSFEFTVKAPSGVTLDHDADYGATVTWVDANTFKVTVSSSDTDGVTVTNLPVSKGYTVTETVPADYTSTNSEQTAEVASGSTATAAFSNTFLTGDLKITKKVEGTNAPDNGTFTFTVKATGDTATKVAGKEFGSISFNADGTLNSTVEITVSRGTGSTTIENLPIGTYTVEENTAGLTNYGTPTYANAANTAGVTVTKNGTATVTVTNHYNQPTGSLTITKTVTGTNAPSVWSFEFTVKAPSGVTLDHDADYGATVTWVDANTFKVTVSSSDTDGVTVTNLPVSKGYTVTETVPADYTSTGTGSEQTAEVKNGDTTTVAFTNTYQTGSLTITKEVKGTNAPTTWEFTFTVKAPSGVKLDRSADYGATITSWIDDNTFTVKVNQGNTAGVTIKNLPGGTYTVTETVPGDYEAKDSEQTAKVESGKTATAAFTNTYKTGTLTISKTVAGNTSAVGESFTFTITAGDEATKKQVGSKEIDGVQFTNGTAEVTIVMDGATTEKSIKGLPAGSYSVSEKTADNYTVKETEPQTVKITSNGNVERVSFTNTYDTGDLTITKNVTGGTNVKVSQTFTFTVQAPDNLIKDGTSFTVTGGAPAVFDEHGEAEVTVTLSNSNTGSVTIEGLPVGRYTITEKDVPTGYTASGPETVTVAKGTTPATATITNELQTTNLTVKKEKLEHDPNVDLPTNPTFTFAVAFTNFPAGVTSFECGTNCTVTTANNIVTFTLKENGSQTLAGIPAGIGFEVTEAFQSDDLGRHFTTEWLNRTGTLNSSTTVTCTNTYHMLEVGNGALVIRKEAVGGQADTKYQFKVTFTQGGHPYTGQIGGKTLGSDGSAIFEMDDTINHVLVIQVPVGVAYTVEEVFASGERPKKISVRLEQNEAGDSTSGETASGTISQEFNYDSVIFTNRYLGDLTISKTVPQFNGGEDFTFTVTLPTGTYNYTGDKSGTISSGGTVTLKAGESITIQNLPAGSTYTVTEAGTANYTSSSVGATGTIANNTTAEAKFTNNRNTGSLTVTKTLTGKLAASNDTFTFTVTLTGVGTGFNGTLGDVTFTNGVGTITITGARSKTITGLPVGAGFTVKEQDAAGYVTTYNNDPANHDKAEGTISANPTTVTVNNDKPDTGTITIKKVVKNAPAANANKEFNFTITLYLDEDLTEVATDVNGEHSGFNFTNGVASFTLKNGDSVIGEGEVTVGEGRLFYKIEETADPDYTTTSENTDTNGKANGRVVTGEFTQDSQNTTVTFTNTYNYGDLTITKKVTDDSGASHANDKFTFTITKVGDSTFNQTVEITGANSKTVTLPAGEYIVTETAGMGDSVAYRVGTSGASAANAEVTITAGGTVTVTVTNTYYSGGGTGGTGGGGTPSPDIDTSEHYGYIIGVTHTEVAPEQNITRAEIATILFRLLTDEARAANWSENSGFPDVKSGVWYNHAVAVLHKMGIILGDDNGNFNPDQNITRAEVAAMVVRFYEVAEGTVLNNRFTDVETTKWYAEAVLLADYYGLMQGDGDAFKPEDLLTRAEAMTVFNRLLGRKPHKDHLHKDMITWTDNTDRNKWYYAEVQEATNSHTCGNNVVIDGKTYETWSAITKMRDWAALEY